MNSIDDWIALGLLNIRCGNFQWKTLVLELINSIEPIADLHLTIDPMIDVRMANQTGEGLVGFALTPVCQASKKRD